MTPKLESLFWTTHLDTDQNWLLLALKLALWAPFGCVLLLIRLIGSVIIIAILTILLLAFPSLRLPLFIRKLLLQFIGIRVRIEGAENINDVLKAGTSFILTCNHRTAFAMKKLIKDSKDVLPFGEFAPLAVMMDAGFFDAHWLSRWFLKSVKPYLEPIRVEHYAGREQDVKEAQRQNILRSLQRSGRPLFYFPEGWDTNGRGVLRYQKFMFSLDKPIIPAALNVSIPFAPFRPGMLGSSIFREIIWLFFSPCYNYHIIIQPTLTRGQETEIEFANRTQRLTAFTLGVPAMDFCKSDALAYRRSLVKKKHA